MSDVVCVMWYCRDLKKRERLVCNLVGKIHSFDQGIFTKHLSYETICSAMGHVLQNDNTKQNVINIKDEEKITS